MSINYDFADLEAFLGGQTGKRMLIDEVMARGRLALAWTYEAERSTTTLSQAEPAWRCCSCRHLADPMICPPDPDRASRHA